MCHHKQNILWTNSFVHDHQFVLWLQYFGSILSHNFVLFGISFLPYNIASLCCQVCLLVPPSNVLVAIKALTGLQLILCNSYCAESHLNLTCHDDIPPDGYESNVPTWRSSTRSTRRVSSYNSLPPSTGSVTCNGVRWFQVTRGLVKPALFKQSTLSKRLKIITRMDSHPWIILVLGTTRNQTLLLIKCRSSTNAVMNFMRNCFSCNQIPLVLTGLLARKRFTLSCFTF